MAFIAIHIEKPFKVFFLYSPLANFGCSQFFGFYISHHGTLANAQSLRHFFYCKEFVRTHIPYNSIIAFLSCFVISVDDFFKSREAGLGVGSSSLCVSKEAKPAKIIPF